MLSHSWRRKWTIQYPDGSHKHAYPGGKIRSHKETISQPIDNGVLVFVGTVGIALIALDDLTGIGVVDDILIPVIGAACFCDVNQLVPKKQRCTLCGGEWYGY